MAAKLQEIEGRFHGERFRKGDFLIGTILLPRGEGELAIKGECEPDELEFRKSYRFLGKYSTWKNRRTGQDERQFEFQTFVAARAHDRDGVVAYLEAAGKGNGIGRKTAAKAWDRWNSDAVRVIREEPSKLLEINGRLTEEQLTAIQFSLQQSAAIEDATIEVTNLLAGRKFPKTTARSAIKAWGNRAAQVIRRDPYSLMRFRGCGFKLCDALYCELGLDPKRLRRQAIAAWYAVASDTSGNVWYEASWVAEEVRRMIGSGAEPVRAITMAVRLGRRSPNHYGALAIQRTDGPDGFLLDDPDAENAKIWLGEGRLATHERNAAIRIAKAIDECRPRRITVHEEDGGDWEEVVETEPLWPKVDVIKSVTDHQRTELGKAMQTPIGVLGGSPGTGKTWSVAQLVKSVLAEGKIGLADIAVAGPTGKSAVRVTEQLVAASIPLKARTWHSHLGIGATNPDTGEQGFLHNRANPWRYKLMIGDESSMNDLSIFAATLAARPHGCHMLLVGDVYQLPPVGPGAPLRDLIASQTVGYGELREIKRNSGGIVEACAAIRDGEPWGEGDNLHILETQSDHIQHILKTLRRHTGQYDPIWDCQILTAVNDRSQLSRKILNRVLQDELNPGKKLDGTPFRLGDKVVCLKNGRYTAMDADLDARQETEGDSQEVYVANGEIGKVVRFDEKSIEVELSAPYRLVRVPLSKSNDKEGDGESKGAGCNWDLAYALSVHKAQGSEFPIAIGVLDPYPGARRICDRSWLYTNISRAREHCYLVGQKAIADSMCRRTMIHKRKTLLRERLQREVNRMVMEALAG